MRGFFDTERWTKALGEALPGEQAQLEMAPKFRGEVSHKSDPIPAAVMMLMFPIRNTIGVVFIKRNSYDGPHSAQVSFPGGAWETYDESLEQTAIRETREELGITEKIHILGSLSKLHIPVSNFIVAPYAAWMEKRPEFHPDPSEVQYVIESSLEELLNPANILTDTWKQDEGTIVAPYYRVGKEKIWGATAMMLCEFLQVASRMQ